MWGFATDVRVQADCATVLAQLLEIVRSQADDGFRRRAAARIAGWQGLREERCQRVASSATQQGSVGRRVARLTLNEDTEEARPDIGKARRPLNLDDMA